MNVEAAQIELSSRGLRAWQSGRPWIFRDDLARRPDLPAAATPVYGPRRQPLGWADYSPQSQIALRMLSRRPEAVIDDAFWRLRLRHALAYRRKVVHESEAFRVVWGEADGLPGLVADLYGQALAVQFLTAAMAARQDFFLAELQSLLEPQALALRNDSRARLAEGLSLESHMVTGAATARCRIHGLEWEFDVLAGQKTGAFLDQRENWMAARSWLGRSLPYAGTPAAGARVLDVCCYQGGFALCLAAAGARVEGVDLSRPALERADANARRNQLQISWTQANAFDLLRDYQAREKRYEMIVLDPPAFAKSRRQLAGAARGYKELNLRALQMLVPGGLLISCSCSHHVSEANLIEIIAAAAQDARTPLRILERRQQALDHPVLANMPESGYLKCLVFQAGA